MADVQESGGATEVLTWGTMSIFLDPAAARPRLFAPA